MTKDHQTTVIYGDDIKEWVSDFTDEFGGSKAQAFRYAVRQQMQREQEP